MNQINKEDTPFRNLKQLRLEKKFSLEDVHKSTHIPIKILEAIEEERIPNISPVYLKGFIKLYCNFLGVDYRDYLDVFLGKEKNLKKEKSLFLESDIKVKRGLDYIFRIKNKKIFLSVFIMMIIAGLIFFKTKKLSLKKEPTKPEANLQKAALEKPPLVEPQPQTKSHTVNKILKVRLRAKEDCWVKASVDKKIVFQGILKKGRFESWEARQTVELSLGNAGGVELYVNESPFLNLGKSKQLIRKVLINHEGIQVLR